MKKPTPQPTVEDLNAIQMKWMAFDPLAAESEKKQMFALMAKYPDAYLSVSDNLAVANVVIAGQPCWAHGRPIRQATDYLLEVRGPQRKRLDVAWCGARGKWVAINQ